MGQSDWKTNLFFVVSFWGQAAGVETENLSAAFNLNLRSSCLPSEENARVHSVFLCLCKMHLLAEI